MAFPGQRFALNLDDDEPAPVIDSGFDDDLDDNLPSSALIGEIHERAPSAAVAAPKPPSGSGFPQRKKRFQKSSFKQRRAQQQQQQQQQPEPRSVASDKQSIDEENRRQLAGMSGAQIQHEREELMSSMDPGLLERFLRRARVDDSQAEPEPQPEPQPQPEASTKPGKSVSFDVPEPEPPQPAKVSSSSRPESSKQESRPVNDDLPPPTLPDDLHPASELPSFHFPTPPQPPSNDPVPSLDPSSPSFLNDLQTHYFPNTPHDPSSLTWLQQPSSDPDSDPDPSRTSPYAPTSTAEAIHPAAIRFSLLGTILAPGTALALPTTLGLHHHGNDPQAAGYTIPEITILGRSSFPAQRCVAWQVLGRILYRLGKGEFGERGSVLVEGLWEVVEKEAVVGVMLVEAEGASAQQKTTTTTDDNAASGGNTVKGAGIGRHASAAAWAVEGVWLWQKGGGGDRGVLKEGVIRPR